MERRRILTLLGSLYVVTAAVHGWLLSGVWIAPYIAHDEVQYCMIGENIRAGHGFLMRGTFASTAPPLYPLFVALGHSLAGNPRVGVYILSVLTICALLFPAYLIGRDLTLSAPLAAAGALAATFLPQTFYAGMYMSETLQLPLFLLAFWLALRWLRSGTLAAGVQLGTVFGVMALNRFATFTFFACFLAAAAAALGIPGLARFHVSRRRAAASLGLVAAGVAIAQGGWWAYKVVRGGTALGTYASAPGAWGHTGVPLFVAYIADAFLAPGIIVAAPFCVGLVRLWKKQPPAALFLAIVVATLVCTTAFSDGSLTGFLRERYFIYCFPLILLGAVLGAREYFTSVPIWITGVALFALPLMCLFGLMLYDFHVPALVESSWAHATGALSLADRAEFSRDKLLSNGLLLIAIGGAVLIASRRRAPVVLTAWLLLFNLYALARVGRDIAQVTRGIKADVAPIVELFPRGMAPLQKVIVAGYPPGWDDRSLPQTPRFIEASSAAGLTDGRIWYVETMERLDVRMCGSPYCVLSPAAAGAYFLTAVDFPNLKSISAHGPFHLYRIPPRVTPGGGMPVSISARGGTALAAAVAPGVYKARWQIATPPDVPVRAEVSAGSKVVELEEGPAGSLPELFFVADRSTPAEFRLRAPARPDVVFRGVQLWPEAVDARLATVEYGELLAPGQFLTRIGERLPDQSLASRGGAGFLCYGPYRKLPPGKYKVTFQLHSRGEARVHADVAADGSALAAADGLANDLPPLEFSTDGKAGLEYRVITTNGTDVIFSGAKLVPLDERRN